MKVRLHTISISDYSEYLRYPEFITAENFLAELVSSDNGKAQIVNFNLEDIDDTFAKTLTKVYTKMLFTFTKRLKNRASIPFHVFLEEAHRYVQEDSDRFLLGYNIFERVAKEGRKYGLIFNLISQRPVEISETVISQVANFIIFKMTHPRDLDYIKKMLPNISADIIEKQKSLQPGTCVAFGRAFKVPMIIKMEAPTPPPESSNADIVKTWTVGVEPKPQPTETQAIEQAKTEIPQIDPYSAPVVLEPQVQPEIMENIVDQPMPSIPIEPIMTVPSNIFPDQAAMANMVAELNSQPINNEN